MDSPKSYDETTKGEAAYAAELGEGAVEDKFHATYTAILSYWFPTSKGYVIDHQVMGDGGKPEYIVVRHAGVLRNPLLIVELKRPKKWNDAGRKEVRMDLVEYIEGRFKSTMFGTIYGLAGIGLRWKALKMSKEEGPEPDTVVEWQDDISSDESFLKMQKVAELVYNLK